MSIKGEAAKVGMKRYSYYPLSARRWALSVPLQKPEIDCMYIPLGTIYFLSVNVVDSHFVACSPSLFGT
jgi:hypothetical protein